MLDLIVSYLVKGLACILFIIPMRVTLWLGRRVGRIFYILSGKRKHITYANLKAAFASEKSPSEIRKLTIRTYMHMAETFAEVFSMTKINKAYTDKYIDITGYEEAKRIADSSQGMVFVSAHYGNWELCVVKSVHIGMPMYLLARDQKMQKTYENLNVLREAKGNKVVRKGMDIKNVFRILRDGKTLGVLGDQNAGVNGELIDLFGRPASQAVGPFRFAQKTGSPVLPAFMHRVKGKHHKIDIEPPIHIPKDADLRPYMEKYVRLLEGHIRDYPEQWLWMHKKWKVTPLRKIMVLDDGKKGHLKQSLTCVKLMRKYRESEGFAPEHIQVEIVPVRFRSKFRKAVLNMLAPFFSRREQGRMRKLRWALDGESYNNAINKYADIIVSCGSSLYAVNKLLKIENNARSVVIMDPGKACRDKFDLVLVPAHDAEAKGISGDNIVITDMAPNLMDKEELKEMAGSLDKDKWFGAEKNIGVLIGGDNQYFGFTPDLAKEVASSIKNTAEQIDANIHLTTSRRTPEDAERVFEEELGKFFRCAHFIKGSEDKDDKTVEKILASSDIIVVSGESISMISEAVASGKPVMVFMPEKKTEGITKFESFVEELREKGYLISVKPSDIPAEANDILTSGPKFKVPEDNKRISEKLYRLF